MVIVQMNFEGDKEGIETGYYGYEFGILRDKKERRSEVDFFGPDRNNIPVFRKYYTVQTSEINIIMEV